MDKNELQTRTKRFALEVIRLVETLPGSKSADVLGRQVLRSATSVAANYRAACRGRSKREFIARLGIVVEEADESLFWLELMSDAELAPPERLQPLVREANELTAIFVASRKTAQRRK